MATQERCAVCRRKGTMQERVIGEQTAMMCTKCSWLDPSTIKDIEPEEIKEG